MCTVYVGCITCPELCLVHEDVVVIAEAVAYCYSLVRIVQVVLCFAGLMENMGLYTEFLSQHVDADPLVQIFRQFDIFTLLDKLKGAAATVSQIAG